MRWLPRQANYQTQKTRLGDVRTSASYARHCESICARQTLGMRTYKYRTEANGKDIRMKQHKPILINMPQDLLEQLDAAAKNLDLCQSEMLRQCLQRDLTFIADRQLHRFDEATQSTVHDYAKWSSTILSQPQE